MSLIGVPLTGGFFRQVLHLPRGAGIQPGLAHGTRIYSTALSPPTITSVLLVLMYMYEPGDVVNGIQPAHPMGLGRRAALILPAIGTIFRRAFCLARSSNFAIRAFNSGKVDVLFH